MIKLYLALMGMLLWASPMQVSATVKGGQGQIMRTICVGHFQLDIPDDFEVVELGNKVRGVSVVRLGAGDFEALASIFFARVNQLKEGRDERDGIPLIYVENRQIGDILMLATKPDLSSIGVVSDHWDEEAYVVSNGVMFRLEGYVFNDTVAADQQNILDVAGALFPRENSAIPKAIGACLPDAFVKLPAENENFSASFMHSDQSPLGYQVYFDIRAPGGERLDTNTDIVNDQAIPIEIAGMLGFEVRSKERQLSFHALSGQSSGESAGGIQIIAQYFDQRPNYGSAPVSLEEAENLWVRVLSSIKVRQ